jgi:hypothetical protein
MRRQRLFSLFSGIYSCMAKKRKEQTARPSDSWLLYSASQGGKRCGTESTWSYGIRMGPIKSNSVLSTIAESGGAWVHVLPRIARTWGTLAIQNSHCTVALRTRTWGVRAVRTHREIGQLSVTRTLYGQMHTEL